MDYYIVSQGKTTIPSVNDGEEFELTDVRHRRIFLVSFFFCFYIWIFIVKLVFKKNTHWHQLRHANFSQYTLTLVEQ